MIKLWGLAGLLLLTGCSSLTKVGDYNKDLTDFTDFTGGRRVGIGFSMNHNRTRVYPETKACIDLYSKANGFIPVISWRDKSIGIPTIAGMSEKRQEFGVSANELITIRVLYPGEADNKYFFSSGVNVAQSVITFKPEVGSFCYVTIDFKHQESKTGKYLRVYKIVDNAAGKKELQHVNILNVPNCPGQQPWYTQMGAVM